MWWPFRRRLTGSDATLAIEVIRHLQTQMALQQLAMETYNTALTMAGSEVDKGDEMFVRGTGIVSDPHLGAQYLLPALEKKVDIAEVMQREHRAFQVADRPKKARQAYERWTDLLAVFLARARLQLTCWNDWVDNPSRDVSKRSTALDQAESESMNVAIRELNELIEQAGLSGEPWFSINCAAFNDARNRIGLPPLTETDFRAKFLQGLTGGRPRFFE